MSRLKARRKADRQEGYAWRDVVTYERRRAEGGHNKYSRHIKAWDKEELEKWKAERKYKGQTKSSKYRLFKRFLRDIRRKIEIRLKKEEKEREIDRDEDIFDAAENRDEQQRQDTKDRNDGQ